MTEPATLPPSLERTLSWVHAQPWLARFTLMNRLLLAMAFLPTGLVKATGRRFTILPVENPVGFFFEAMYQTGPYWHFIGFAQVLAAVLLLIPGTATLGALLFLPIGISVFLITWGVGFGNTVYVTAGMLLAVIYLVCWDGDRIWAASARLLGRRTGPPLLAGMTWLERSGWIVGGLAGMGMFLAMRSFVPMSVLNELFFIGLAAIGMVVAGWTMGAVRQGRTPAASKGS